MTLADEQLYADRLPCPICGHLPVVEERDGDWLAFCQCDVLFEDATTQAAAIRRWNQAVAKVVSTKIKGDAVLYQGMRETNQEALKFKDRAEAAEKERDEAQRILKTFQAHQESIECCLPDGRVCGKCTVCELRELVKRLVLMASRLNCCGIDLLPSEVATLEDAKKVGLL